jgi:hypothetical protein
MLLYSIIGFISEGICEIPFIEFMSEGIHAILFEHRLEMRPGNVVQMEYVARRSTTKLVALSKPCSLNLSVMELIEFYSTIA